MRSSCPHCSDALRTFDKQINMKDTVFFLNMFSCYEPPEELTMALSQAAVVAADILPESGSIHVAVHSPEYIPQSVWDRTANDIAELYGLRELTVSATYPASQLRRMEPGELMQLFVAQDSMA